MGLGGTSDSLRGLHCSEAGDGAIAMAATRSHRPQPGRPLDGERGAARQEAIRPAWARLSTSHVGSVGFAVDCTPQTPAKELKPGIRRPGTQCTRAVSGSPARRCGLRAAPTPQPRPGRVGRWVPATGHILLPSRGPRGSPVLGDHSPRRLSLGPREAWKGPLRHLLGFETAVRLGGLADLSSNPVSIAT